MRLTKAEYEEAKKMQNGIPLFIPSRAQDTIDYFDACLQTLVDALYTMGDCYSPNPDDHEKGKLANIVIHELEVEGWIHPKGGQ